MTDFQCVTPILNVKNLAASMDYYVQKLGFEKKWDWGDPPDFGCVGRGKVEIFEICCALHNLSYVAKSVMWRSAFLASSQQQTSEPNAT